MKCYKGHGNMNLQVSKRDEGRDVEVVDIHGAGRDVGGPVLEVLVGEEPVLGFGSEDLGVLLKERNDNGVVIFLHVVLLKSGTTRGLWVS